MRKLISLALALVMILSLSTVAFAVEGGAPTNYVDSSTIELTKQYDAANPGTTSPAETFTFSTLTCTSVTDAAEGVTINNAPVPRITDDASFTHGAAGSTNKTDTVTITLPEYTSVGIYTYTFTETDGGTAGVTYRTDAIELVVTVIEQNGKVRVATVHTEASGEKSDVFTNTYSAGSLNVKKVVTGIMGDQSKYFNVNVTFSAPEGDTVREAISYIVGTETKTIPANWSDSKTVSITLKHDDTVTFTNIPYGVTYTVVENDYSSDGYDAATYVNKEGTINAASTTATITNNKGGTVDTGISMDSVPYVLLLAVATMGLAVLFTKKRMMREF